MTLRAIAIFLLVGGMLSACAAPPVAVPPPSPAELLADAQAQDFTCPRTGAVAVDFAKIAAAPQQYTDKCVRLRGLAKWHALYLDASTMAPAKTAANAHAAIGLYWMNDDGLRRLDGAPQFVEIVGRVRACDARNKLMQAAGATDSAGSCQTGAIAIFVVQYRIFPTAMD